MSSTPKITTFLWFNDNAEEAINHYCAIFKNSKIIQLNRRGDKLFLGVFELEGQRFMALNGGPMFKFTEAISLYVDCETQEEVDSLWDKLIAGGGEASRCGWLKDRFGLSWQIIPKALGQLMGSPIPAKAQKVMEAMLKMQKLDIATLQRAHDEN